MLLNELGGGESVSELPSDPEKVLSFSSMEEAERVCWEMGLEQVRKFERKG